MNAPVRARLDIREASDASVRDDIYRFRYRVYVEQMGRRQKYADHERKMVIEPLDRSATIYAAYQDNVIVGTVRGNRFSDPETEYYRKIYRIDGRFGYRLDEMTLSTKLIFEPALQRSVKPIRLIAHYAECFHFGGGGKIDFLDCNKHLIPFFTRFGYLDYQGWIVHSEYGTVRPLCCPADQLRRFNELRSPFAEIAPRFYRENQFGGVDLANHLARSAPDP